MRRSRARTVLAVLFGFFTLEAWVEVLLAVFAGSDSPHTLVALQIAVGIAGVFATRGIWTGARWAPIAVLVYGAITGGMLAALPFILGLEAEARRGIWSGGAGVVLCSLAVAWYLRRARRESLTSDQTRR